MLDASSLTSLSWVCLVVVLACYAFELATSVRLAKYMHSEIPLVAKPSIFTPRCISNLVFATDAVRIVNAGYLKFKRNAFRLIRNDGSIVVLPPCLLDEVARLPSSVATGHEALEQDLLGRYTGLNLILESRLHHSIVQRKLTPRLGLLTPALEEEVRSAVEKHFPQSHEWVQFEPYHVLAQVSATVSARALVGPELCRNEEWLNIAVNYTENLFRTLVIMRLVPYWLHPIVFPCVPSFWACRRYLQKAKALLKPVFGKLIEANDKGLWAPENNAKDSNALCWLASSAQGRDRNADTLAHVEVLLAVASVHTILLRMVNVLYDITAEPKLGDELRAEIAELQAGQYGYWHEASYNRLDMLDSVLRESQRLSGPTTLGMKRLFRQSHTFSNGLHVPKRTYACLPIFAMQNDAQLFSDPDVFDGLRSHRYRREQQKERNPSMSDTQKSNDDEHLFSSLDSEALNFGYGKHACPGRHFASLVLKILFVKLLTEYEFKFLDNTARPKNIMVHEFLFCWPWQKMLVRRKLGSRAPF